MNSGRTRRQVLRAAAAIAAVPVAGCATPPGMGPAARLRLTEFEPTGIPQRVLYSIGIDDGPDPREDLMDDILDGGTTVEDTRPPIPAGQHIYYDDVVYLLDHEVEQEIPATKFQIRLDIVQGTVNEAEAVQFDALPAVDREKFAERGWDEGMSFGFGTSILYTDAEAAQSDLVPDSEYAYILWDDGSEAAWFVDDAHDTSIKTYRYAAEQIATAAAYGREMRQQFGFELFGLTEAERSIVETAIDEEDGYIVEQDQTPSTAFWSLTDRFDDADRIHGLQAGDEPNGPKYIVQYDGAWYTAVLLVRVEREEPA